MMWRTTLSAVAIVCIGLAGSGRLEAQAGEAAFVSNVVTTDIQAGIEKHIEEQVAKGGGYFHLDFGEKKLKLKLVRVHMEYLSNLGPGHHFACVDLADVSGDVFDVDFFLKGNPGSMSVTETTVHKINGQCYYAWDQHDDGTWHRIPVEKMKETHQGILRDRDEFEFRYRATLPEIPNTAKMWIPIATSDTFQTVEVLSIDVPGKQTRVVEKKYGNQVLFVELDKTHSGKTLEIRYHVTRLEKAAYPESASESAKFLAAERLVPLTEDFRAIAAKTLEGKKGELVRARALYDHTIDQIKYAKFGPGWGKGDAVYACDSKSGNCTDFHAYFIALARAAGIPARFAIGAAIPSDRNDGGVDGYHCWAEFYAEGKWWPVDISEADKYSNLSTYYFAHHPANRIEFSRGRDLEVEPAPASGPLNFLAYPALEIDGKLVKTRNDFTFQRLTRKR